MPLTYSLNNLNTPLAKVRRKIGDTNEDDPLLDDAEINQVILERPGSVLDQSTECVRNILAKISRDVDRSNLGMSATRSQKFEHYATMLTTLEAESAGGALPFAGGVSRSDKESLANDSDFTQPMNERGQHSIEGADHHHDHDDHGSG